SYLSEEEWRSGCRVGMLYNVCQEERALSASSLTPEEAKAKVLDHWHQLNALALWRFPKDQNLAHEGLLYVLKHLEAEDWRRVRPGRAPAVFAFPEHDAALALE
ncbi:MAG: hypothetical protein ACREX9_10680, partial [Gammaproteobacteria bacterium]